MIARAPMPYLLGWPVWASIAAHGAAMAAASTVIALAPHAPPPAPAPIEVVRVEPPSAPPPPPERPKPIRRERAVAPRVITQPIEQARSAPSPPLLGEAPQRAEASPMDAPTSAPSRMPGAPSAQNWALSGSPAGSAAGSGQLFSTGDLPLPPGGGGNKEQTASTQQRASPSGGNPTDLTSFARPLGGYQTRPRYPDSARRQGIEGEALLRFQVLTDGHVASVTVTRSAGHADLDRAAVDAVKTWRFEPARRGEEKVAVWVTLPVRFQLQSGLLSE